jgi:Methyladenine glycosylase
LDPSGLPGGDEAQEEEDDADQGAKENEFHLAWSYPRGRITHLGNDQKAPRMRDTTGRVPGQAPKKIDPSSPGDYLEVMTKAVFQSGISWRVIDAKWDGFREAFDGFDAGKVAALTPEDVDRLAQDTRIVRNRRKIQATVDNAVELIELDREHGGFRNWLRSHGSFEDTVADLKRHFAFLGDTGSYYFLYVVGEKVPPHEEWMAARSPSR